MRMCECGLRARSAARATHSGAFGYLEASGPAPIVCNRIVHLCTLTIPSSHYRDEGIDNAHGHSYTCRRQI